MGTKGSNTTTTDTTQSYAAHPTIERAATKSIGMATDAADQPFQMPQAPVAGFNPFQQQAFGQVQGMQGMSQPYFNLGQQYLQQSAAPVSANDVNQYYNPMADNVTRQMQNIFGQQNQQNTAGLTQAAGGVGADRIAVGQANMANQQGLAAGQTYAGLYQQALQAAQQNKQMQAGTGYGIAQMGPAAQNASLQGTQALGAAGGAQQQQSQAELNSPYQQELARIAFPYQQAQYLAGITGGTAGALGGTTTGHSETTKPSPSPWAQALGVGASLLGTALGGPMGGMIGGAIGGSMGGGKGSSPGNMGGTGMPGYGGLYKRGGAVNPFDFGQGFDAGGEVGEGESWEPEPLYDYETPGRIIGRQDRLPAPPSWGDMANNAGNYYSGLIPDAVKTMGSNLIAGPAAERTPIFPSLKATSQLESPPPSFMGAEAATTPPSVGGGQGGIGSDRSNLSWGNDHPPPTGIPLPLARPTASAVPPPSARRQAFPAPAGGGRAGPMMNADLSMDMPRERMPYPDSTERDWGQKMARSPWMALVKAGAKMAQTTGPIGSVIGAGIEAGSGHLDAQRNELRSEEGINQRAQQLYQSAQSHLDKYQRKTPHEVATERFRSRAMASTTALQKNAQWLVESGIAPDINTAYQMAHSGVNQGAVYARLIAAEKKRLSSTPEGATMDETKLEAEATRQVMGRLSAGKPAAGAAPIAGNTVVGASAAAPSDSDRTLGKSSPEMRAKFIKKFGTEP